MKIAKKYLSSSSSVKSYRQVRKWVHEDVPVREIVEALTAAYGEAKDKDKLHICSMLAMAYDFGSPNCAEKCLGLMGMAKAHRMSVGQTVYLRKCGELGYVDWDEEYSEGTQGWMPLVEEFDTGRWPGIVYDEHSGRVLTIDREDNIYAFRNCDGAVTLFILNDCKYDMLIDESSFMDESPLYFTEKSHFVSPVYKINLAGGILDFCLAKIGYPSIKIKRDVVFTSHLAHLINIDDYTRPDIHGHDWDGVTVGFSAKSTPPYFHDCIHFLDESNINSLSNDVLNMVIDSLAATSILYKRIKIAFRESFVRVDDELLKRLAEEENIFR